MTRTSLTTMPVVTDLQLLDAQVAELMAAIAKARTVDDVRHIVDTVSATVAKASPAVAHVLLAYLRVSQELFDARGHLLMAREGLARGRQ